ncbi:hypothetical protein E1281_27215, partial [Actinomadura sp. KC345]|uniref:hypothetical protein n=1 Tax=Actinomadura sp. KC345 TaxID=2530371 RepID=UPI00104A1E55
MQHFRPGAAGKAARWTVAVVTFIVAVTFVALLYVWSEQGVAGIGDARDTLGDDAFFILAFFFTVVVTGAVLHTPFALRGG